MAGRSSGFRQWEWGGLRTPVICIPQRRTRGVESATWLRERAHRECPGSGAAIPPYAGVQRNTGLVPQCLELTSALLDATRVLQVQTALPFAAPDFHVEAHYAILVADGHNGNVFRDIVLGANDLLRSL